MPKTCFVIAPIGDEKSSTRDRSDKVLRHLIAPVLAGHGYEAPVRADHIASPGMITSQVIQHLVDDDMVIADLSAANPNVYYELAVRHMVRRPLVQIIEKGEPIPFDVAGSRTIVFDHHDLDSVESARTHLSRQLQAAERDAGSVDNPISIALDLKALRSSSDPVQRSIAAVASELAVVREDVRAIRHDQNVLDRLRMWDKVVTALRSFEESKPKSTIYDADEVMDKVEDLESRVDDLEDKVKD